jgi:hypothetical protein
MSIVRLISSRISLRVALLAGLACGPLTGCMFPAFQKLTQAQLQPKPKHDHFSCGEDCPYAKKEVRRTESP